ncbi:MAG TPA: hypothetical protein VG097_08800, partial [Gemmata sp.]|nr:hypothetical protein [Gemmata sp.]
MVQPKSTQSLNETDGHTADNKPIGAESTAGGMPSGKQLTVDYDGSPSITSSPTSDDLATDFATAFGDRYDRQEHLGQG